MSDWKRVSRSEPCVICGEAKRCTRTADGAVAKCVRVEDGAFSAGNDAAGDYFLHRLIDDPDWRDNPRPAIKVKPKLPAPEEVAKLARQAERDITPEQRRRFSAQMGLSPESLRRVRLGWIGAETLDRFDTPCHDSGCWTFPMDDGLGNCAGIRLRTPGGVKYALRTPDDCMGAGIFIPRGLGESGKVYAGITEGPTDLAALLDMGFDAIGRPSNTGGRQMIKRFVALNQDRFGWREIFILIDRDKIGSNGSKDTMRGARALADDLSSARRTVRVCRPPAGVNDARDWLATGANEDDLLSVVEATTPKPSGRFDWIRRNKPESQTA